MKERLYKISGTGWFFHDFYVMAESAEFAKARAHDIVCAEYRAKSGKYMRTSAIDQIQSVVPVVPGTVSWREIKDVVSHDNGEKIVITITRS